MAFVSNKHQQQVNHIYYELSNVQTALFNIAVCDEQSREKRQQALEHVITVRRRLKKIGILPVPEAANTQTTGRTNS